MNNDVLAEKIIRLETGRMTIEEEIAFFQELVDNGIVWELDGHYARVARMLIDARMVVNHR